MRRISILLCGLMLTGCANNLETERLAQQKQSDAEHKARMAKIDADFEAYQRARRELEKPSEVQKRAIKMLREADERDERVRNEKCAMEQAFNDKNKTTQEARGEEDAVVKQAMFYVTRYLVAPSTAKFLPTRTDTNLYNVQISKANGSYRVLFVYDSQNRFGAMIRGDAAVYMDKQLNEIFSSIH